jgi:hypothetical protein
VSLFYTKTISVVFFSLSVYKNGSKTKSVKDRHKPICTWFNFFFFSQYIKQKAIHSNKDRKMNINFMTVFTKKRKKFEIFYYFLKFFSTSVNWNKRCFNFIHASICTIYIMVLLTTLQIRYITRDKVFVSENKETFVILIIGSFSST